METGSTHETTVFSKANWITICVATLASPAVEIRAQQQNFTDLDFESANIPSGTQPGALVLMPNALPGWQITTIGANGLPSKSSLPDAIYNSSEGSFSIYDSHATDGITPLQGNYSVVMTTSSSTPGIGLYQEGLVPAGTKSLLIEASSSSPGVPFQVTLTENAFSSDSVQMIPLETTAGYTLYGGDISSLAGQTEGMKINFYPDLQTLGPGQRIELDAITFSPDELPVPEPRLPSTMAFALFAGAMTGQLRRKKQAHH